MSTLTATPYVHTANEGYVQNVLRAARALIAALLAVPASTPAQKTAKEVRDDVSLRRLYAMAASYDSVMPNLAQELRVIASRD